MNDTGKMEWKEPPKSSSYKFHRHRKSSPDPSKRVPLKPIIKKGKEKDSFQLKLSEPECLRDVLDRINSKDLQDNMR